MNATITVDKAGRVVLPKAVRDELELTAGDSLQLESSGDAIVLRPVRGNAAMRQKEGIWVFRTDEPVSAESVNETIRQLREEREVISMDPRGGKARRSEGSR